MILENPMPKGIIEIYFEFLETNFYAQISCNGHAKFAKIIFILMHRIAIAVFVYISFPTSTKKFCLAVPQTQDKIMAQLSFVQRLQIANQNGYSNFNTRRTRNGFYHNNIWRLCACVVQMSYK